MDKLKDPGSIIAAVDAVAIVGMFAYFQKEINTLKERIGELENGTKQIATRVIDDSKKADQALADTKSEIQVLKKTTKSLASVDDVRLLDQDIEKMVGALSKLDKPLSVERTKKKKKKSKSKSSKKRVVESSSDEDSDDSSGSDSAGELELLRDKKDKKWNKT